MDDLTQSPVHEAKGLSSVAADRTHMITLGADANNTDLILAAVPSHPRGFPGRMAPSAFDAVGLSDLVTRLTDHIHSSNVRLVAIVSDLSSQTSPTNLKPRFQLETALMLAAHRAGADVSELTIGTALRHLDITTVKGKSRRKQLRAGCEAALNPQLLSPAPERRCAAVGVALAASGASLEDMV